MFNVVSNILTKARYGILSRNKWLLSILRICYLLLLKVTPRWTVLKKIGQYGPFKLDRFFAFDDFTMWGNRHNKGFESCIEASRNGKCVLDIGAHIGLVTLPLSQVLSPEGKIYSFEPATINNSILKKHISDNDINNVIIEPYLVGAYDEEDIVFFELNVPTGMNSVVVIKNDYKYIETKKKQISLDSFCTKHDLLPEIIKIDVEGAEIDVLKGGINIIKKAMPIIYLSVHPKHIMKLGKSLEDLNNIIEQLNYKCLTIDNKPVINYQLDEYLLVPINSN